MAETSRANAPSDGQLRTSDYVHLRYLFLGIVLSVIVTVIVFGVYMVTAVSAEGRAGFLERLMAIRFTWPNPQPALILKAPLSVQLHVYGIAVAFFSGITIFLLPKGTGFHRTLGWTFVGAMIIVAATSIMMIWELRTGITFLHIFTVITAVSLYSGLTAIRRGDVRGHANSMIGLFGGGLIVAGAFAFIPGRLMWRVFFGG